MITIPKMTYVDAYEFANTYSPKHKNADIVTRQFICNEHEHLGIQQTIDGYKYSTVFWFRYDEDEKLYTLYGIESCETDLINFK